ncbi:tetratricopeptide repeat protein [Stenomitos frigidus]|uniref:Cyclic nucleotide-binding protein n=1 Tax=Stenomitos frigidus ULC18 TaxID=2107698 RepID=A0A2T1E998_9CYAN|nr:cyclic nucleotide-binding protein [Stenomitos frigidus]PSB29322.1 cyclic nucleotide-binding protein [Stenomitos frigidus ULC18]
MLDEIIAAFDRQDYRLAAQLVSQLLAQSPQNPWALFYAGRLQEVAGKLDVALDRYRQLLRDTTNPKLVIQVRQSIQRVEAIQRERRQQAIAQATAEPNNNATGFLVLEAVTGDDRATVVQNFARAMKLDAYTTRLLIPNRGWRLYRVGLAGELQVYSQELQQAGVPNFWASQPEIQAIQIFRVNSFQPAAPKATVVCQNVHDQIGLLSFDWSEVRQRVEGMLPIFEQVLDLGYRNRLERKEETQDYAHFCDLHLPGRRCILRLHDSGYQFGQGLVVGTQAAIDPLDRNTIRTNWNQLMALIKRQTPQAETWSNFTPFAETAADFTVPLLRLTSHIHLSRQADSYWDSAFQLYSSLILLRGVKQFAS